MVSSQSVLVVAIVNSNLDADAGINEANDCCRNADVIGIPPVRRTSKSNDSS